MKRFGALLLAVLLLISLAGCSGYVSHYQAVGFVHSNPPDAAEMSFHSFQGKIVFQLKCRGSACLLKYSGELQEGTAAVYCDVGGKKTELFSLNAGDSAEAFTELPEKGTVYILVETGETCRNGWFRFALEQAEEA